MISFSFLYGSSKTKIRMKLENKTFLTGGGCLIIAMSTDACWGGHFCVEPGIFVSNRAFLCQTMHFAVEPGFSVKNECYNGPRLTLTPRAGILWVIDQLLSYATASLVDPQHALRAKDGVSADTTTADNTGVLDRFLEDILIITSDQKLGFFILTWSPLLSMPAFHALSLEIHSTWVSVMSIGWLASRSSHGMPWELLCKMHVWKYVVIFHAIVKIAEFYIKNKFSLREILSI